MTEFTFSKAKKSNDDYPSDFPPQEFFLERSDITDAHIDTLRALVKNNSGEKQIDETLRENPELLIAALRIVHTGNHGCWVLSQQMIRPKLKENKPGLIPDFIVGGLSSDGFEWWVVELKGANANLFSRVNNKLQLSSTLNKGMCQLLTYIDYCDEAQSLIRDQLGLTDFRRPKGMIFIGRETELKDDPEKQMLKSAWNNINRTNLEIRTFDSLLRTSEELFSFWKGFRERISNMKSG